MKITDGVTEADYGFPAPSRRFDHKMEMFKRSRWDKEFIDAGDRSYKEIECKDVPGWRQQEFAVNDVFSEILRLADRAWGPSGRPTALESWSLEGSSPLGDETRRTRAAAARRLGLALLCAAACFVTASQAQVPPSAADKEQYTGLLAAAAQGNAAGIKALAAKGATVDVRDAHGRTPLHVAAYGGRHEAMRVLVAAGADPNALEGDRYDVVTIAAVADDGPTLEVALSLGASAKNITSRYDGTALIAAAHLGHAGIVRTLIRAGAPLNHVNNLGWTALIEAIVLGDGGPRHTETLRALVQAGADVNLPDRDGQTPLSLARGRGCTSMADLLRQAGAR